MGFFGRKKKQQEPNILSGNGLIEYAKSNLENPTDENVLKFVQAMAEPDADQEHLTKDGSLPYGWYSLNEEFTSQIKNEYSYFLNCWLDSKGKSPKERYAALKSFVLYMQNTQKLCHSKGECFAYWFEVIADTEYIQARTDELTELEKNLEQLQKEYETRQRELLGLDEKVMHKLKENDGITQADFLRLFPECIKNDVSGLLYQWSNEGKIERIKSGRSYALHIN